MGDDRKDIGEDHAPCVKWSSLNGLLCGVVLMTVTAAIVRPLLGFVGSVTVDAIRRVRTRAEMSKPRVTISLPAFAARMDDLARAFLGTQRRLGHVIECGGGIGSDNVRVGLERGSVPGMAHERGSACGNQSLLRRWIGRRTVVGAGREA